MLKRLYIRNYAIISELDIDLSNGLTIITGETGAGKSILVGALSLVLGKRADSTVLFAKDEKCIVEADFDISDYQLESFFKEHDLDFAQIATLRREITIQGKSRAFVNDTPVNLSQLKELSLKLIDIHSQHEVLTLKTANFRTRFVDLCADSGAQFNVFAKVFEDWKGLKNQVETLKSQLQQASSEEDYLRFQLNELEELDLKEGEFDAVKSRLNIFETKFAELSPLFNDNLNTLIQLQSMCFLPTCL
ncbi:AAA family ATPase [Bacteroidota bacterium]